AAFIPTCNPRMQESIRGSGAANESMDSTDNRRSERRTKMKTFTSVLCALAISATVIPAYAVDKATLDDRLRSGAEVLQEVMNTPDKGIPQSILAGAACVVVIPHYKKGAF